VAEVRTHGIRRELAPHADINVSSVLEETAFAHVRQERSSISSWSHLRRRSSLSALERSGCSVESGVMSGDEVSGSTRTLPASQRTGFECSKVVVEQ